MKKLFLLILAFAPSLCFSQDSDYEKAIDFLEGGNILEDWFMKTFLGEYRNVILQNWSAFIDVAIAIGGIASIVYFAMKAFDLMTGDKEFQIMPLLRPFALCMVIFNWGVFVSLIDVPMNALAKQSADLYEGTLIENRALRFKRAKFQKSLIESLFDEAASNSIAEDAAKKSFWDDPMGATKDAAVDSVLKPIIQLKLKLNITLQQLLTQLLELLALWILRVCVYLVFSLQMIYTAILVFLGPLAVAASIFPWFKDAFKNWTARYISVQFYLVVAFLILTVCSYLQRIAMTAEIDRYSTLLNEDGTAKSIEKIMWLQSNGILSFGFVIVTFLVSALAILSVPKVSTWIINTTGAVGAMSGATRAGQAVMTKGASLLK